MDENDKNENIVTAEEPKTEGVAEQSAQEAKIPFSKLKKRIQDVYPGREFASDDEIDDAGEEYMVSRETADKALTELFDEHPEIVKVLSDLRDGAPSFRAAISAHYSPEELTPQEGDKDYEAWAKSAGSRSQRLEEKKKIDEEYEANIESSIQSIQEFAKENEMDDAATLIFIDKVQGFFDGYNKGLISKDFLSLLNKGLGVEKYGEDRYNEGLVHGRNKQIEAKKINTKEGDGIPSLSGGGEMPIAPKTKTAEERGDDYMDYLKGKKNKF